MSDRRGSGKWGDSRFPGKGWACEGVTDLGSECREICGMCEYQEIRYVHHMSHPVSGLELDTGCVCASRMELDPMAANARERKLKNAIGRRRNWLSRKWRISAKGNHFLNTDGMNVVVYPVSGWWEWRITERSGEHTSTVRSKRLHGTRDRAKLAAFDMMILLKDKWQR